MAKRVEFARYESYKDSGLAWLGMIPTHWGVVRSKALFAVRKERARKDDRQLTASQKYGMLYQDDFMEKEGRRVTQVVLNNEILKHVEPGDFVMSMRSFQGGLEYCPYSGSASSAYISITPLKCVQNHFFKYLFKCDSYIQALSSTSNLVRDGQALRFENFSQVALPVVPEDEQIRIANFLDRKTAEIDEAIAKKHRLIELLKEQKTILINQAVTKGLNPDAPMRDSGVECIGKVPEHWEIRRLGFLASLLQTGPFGSQLHQEQYVDGGIPVINPSQLSDGAITADNRISVSEKTAAGLQRHLTMAGDIILARRGEMGRCGLVLPDQAGYICGTGSVLFRANKLAQPKFLAIALSCDFVKRSLQFVSVGATMDNLNTSILSKLSLPIPPVNEQSEIIDEVSLIEDSHRKVTETLLVGIRQLTEFRGITISSAVTGKIKL